MLKLVPNLKINKSLKLLLVDMKENRSILGIGIGDRNWVRQVRHKTSRNALCSLCSLELE